MAALPMAHRGVIEFEQKPQVVTVAQQFFPRGQMRAIGKRSHSLHIMRQVNSITAGAGAEELATS